MKPLNAATALVVALSSFTIGTSTVRATPTRTSSGSVGNGNAYEIWRMDRDASGNRLYQLKVWRGTNRSSSQATCNYTFESSRDALTFWRAIASSPGCPTQASGNNSSTPRTPTANPQESSHIASGGTSRSTQTPRVPISIATVSPDSTSTSASCNPREQERLAFEYLNWIRQHPREAGQQIGVNLSQVRPRQALRLHPVLSQVARERSEDLGRRRYFGHVDPDGLGPNIKLARAGYSLPRNYLRNSDSNFIESLSAGRATGRDAINSLIIDAGWSTPGHRIHLLAMDDFFVDHTQVGIGFACVPGSPYTYYTTVLTAP